MRKLSVSTLVTLDGVIQDPGGFGETAHGGWGNPYFTADAQQNALEHLGCRIPVTMICAGEGPHSPSRRRDTPLHATKQNVPLGAARRRYRRADTGVPNGGPRTLVSHQRS